MKQFFIKIGKWFDFKDRTKRILIIALALILLGGFMASMVQTDFFSYKVYSKTIETEPITSKAIAQYNEAGEKSRNVADIYMPKSASADNPVPLIMVAPGIQRTKETQASFCIELVRRGYGVLCIDPYAQGESTSSYESQSATNEGYGLFNWMDYLYTEEGKAEFDWVNYDLIGACGHSAGGNGCQKFAEREGKLATENRWEKSRLHGIYITGYIREWTWSNTQCNIGISYSINDEGAFQNATAKQKIAIQQKLDEGKDITEQERAWLEVGNADCRYAPESIAIVNYQINRNNRIFNENQPAVTEVQIGYDYGNQYASTYCIINNETVLHAFQPYDSVTIANLLTFFDYTMEQDSDIAPTNQIWWFKEIGCGMMLVGGFMFMLSLAVLLLRTKAFACLKKELPARTAKQGVRGSIIFWVTFAISATIACLLYMVCVEKSVTWFPEASSGTQTWAFPQRFTNAVMMWAVANGIIGIVMFFITWAIEYIWDRAKARKGGADVALVDLNYRSKLEPVKIDGVKEVLLTLALAAILVGSFFAIDYLCYLIFHADMRFMFLSARITFQPKVILSVLMYLPLFFIFYFSNSFRVNCSMRPANWSEGVSKVIAVLGNTLGLLAILFIEYIPFILTGTIGYTSTVGPQWLFVNLLFSIIPLMAALPLFNRFFFNQTGRAWLGPLVICTIFIAMTGGSTTIYYLLG